VTFCMQQRFSMRSPIGNISRYCNYFAESPSR
jgi:hypothetical protein